MALTDGLIGYFKLDETSGNTLDSVGSAVGTVTGVTRGVIGKKGYAYSFDGNDYVNFGNVSAFNFGVSQDFSISFWIKTTGTSGKFLGKYSDWWGWTFELNGGCVYLSLIGSGGYIYVGGEDINDGNWHHIVAIVDRDGNATMYCDNTTNEYRITDASGVGDIDWTYNFLIGRQNNVDTPDYYVGSLDEIAIYNRVLSLAEIAALYNSGNGVTYPFTTSIALTSSITAGASVSPNLSLRKALASSFSGASSGAANLGLRKAFITAISASSLFTSNVMLKKALASSIAGTGNLQGQIILLSAMAAQLSGSANILVELTILADSGLMAHLYGSTEVEASLGLNYALNTTISAESQVQANINLLVSMLSNIEASSSMEAILNLAVLLTAQIECSSEVVINLSLRQSLTALLESYAAVSARLSSDVQYEILNLICATTKSLILNAGVTKDIELAAQITKIITLNSDSK